MNKTTSTTKLALFAGAAALASLAPQAHAQSADALIDKLVDKGILTANEAKDLRNDSDKDFNTAFAAKTGMPDWVTGYKLSGDVRGRFEQFGSDNNAQDDRTRLRYRLRAGLTVNMLDNCELGFRLTSGDNKSATGAAVGSSTSSTGNPLSNNTTMQDNYSKKMVYIDTAYGKYTAINSDGWLLAATVGKMDNPFTFTPMVFDSDITPEGAALTASYIINDKHSLAFTGAAFVLDEESSSTKDPFMYGAQVTWNAKWNDKWSSSAGVGALVIVSPTSLSSTNVANVNTGNTLITSGPLATLNAPLYNFTPIIADASVTYLFDKAPLYPGAFPVKLAVEGMNNPSAAKNNNGYWAGVTFGKAGAKKTWELTYRYEWLAADAWYAQMVDDDNVAYSGGINGGTNIKSHMFKGTYAITDSLSCSATCYLGSLINNTAGQPDAGYAMHFFADLMWKF
jgi:Putative porin